MYNNISYIIETAPIADNMSYINRTLASLAEFRKTASDEELDTVDEAYVALSDRREALIGRAIGK